VFTGERDFGSALRFIYGDESIWGIRLTSSPQIGAEALSITTYRTSSDTHMEKTC
jgi:hypothetical protein